MNTALKTKLLLLGASVVLLAGVCVASGASLVSAARLVLGVAAVAGFAVWFKSAKGDRARFELPPRLQLVQRVGLSQRTGLALVEVDGQAWIVVHGDGFAKLERAGKPKPSSQKRTLVTDEVVAFVPNRTTGSLS
jgi:hypothetical protein